MLREMADKFIMRAVSVSPGNARNQSATYHLSRRRVDTGIPSVRESIRVCVSSPQ